MKGYMLRHALRRGDIVVDGGAFHGSFTVLAAKLIGPEGRVLAFEPDGRNRAVLRENIELNGLDNVSIVPKGLWSEDRRMGFCEYGEDYSAVSPAELRCSVNERHEVNGEIEMASLDKELERWGIDRLDFLKMDIEGVGDRSGEREHVDAARLLGLPGHRIIP